MTWCVVSYEAEPMHRTVALTLLLLAALTGRDALMAAEIMTPLERVASTPKGLLKSPIQTSPKSQTKAVASIWLQAAMAATAVGAVAGWPHL